MPDDIRRTVLPVEHAGALRNWIETGRGLTLWIDLEMSTDRAGNRITPGDGRASHWRFGTCAFHIDDIVICTRGAELARKRGMVVYRWRNNYEARDGDDVTLVYNAECDDVIAYKAAFTPLSKYLTQEQ